MAITDVSILHHVAIVLVLLWILSYFNCCNPVAYLASFFYLYLVHERYLTRLKKRLQFEERKHANQRRVLCDSETVRWLNHTVEKIWLICMEQIVSQQILLPIIPWFMEKYKPWTAKEVNMQHMYMGRNPPTFTGIRVSRQSTDDDHLVLELGMNFLTADDMSAIMAVKLRRRLGFGMWTKLHITSMHIEGKVKVGVKFLPRWPFLGRLRVCFVEPPYFQMTVKPITTHGIDVTELPGIAGWLDKLLSIAFEQTLVEPNMLVVDMEKFVSPEKESWFTVVEREPIAHAKVEVIEAAEMQPSDLNGLADPYVTGQLGPFKFRTKIQNKTLTPKWQEEFNIPIFTWESSPELVIKVSDKDFILDDHLGDCTINITSELRDGQRHDMWVPLQNIKIGRLHIAITILEEENVKVPDPPPPPPEEETATKEDKTKKGSSETKAAAHKSTASSISSDKSPKMVDKFEPINMKGQERTGIWVHEPGSDIPQTWEPRKGKSRRLGSQEVFSESIHSVGSENSAANDTSSTSTDENIEGKAKRNSFKKTLDDIGSFFSPKKKDKSSSLGDPISSPRANSKPIGKKDGVVNFIVESNISGQNSPRNWKNLDGKKIVGKNVRPDGEFLLGSDHSA